jgi:hypothetical protein
MDSWKNMIEEVMKENKENWGSIVHKAILCKDGRTKDEEFERKFNPDFGLSKGSPFTVWTEKYVYFPAVYDGSEWVECVPRNPCDEPTDHVGGQ